MKKLKCFNSTKVLFELARGEKYDLDDIVAIARWVKERFDCSDFDMQILIRVMYQFEHKLDDYTKAYLKKVILSYKYWIDEPGNDNMCYWSENHQILFAASEYLAGQLYPDEVFTNSGLTGKEHMDKARVNILRWLSLRWKYGFSEWYSNVYYAADIAPLCNLADFCKDYEIATKSMIVLDLLMLDMALQNFKGVFGGTKGRTFEVHKKNPRKESTRIITNSLWGEEKDESPRESLAAFLELTESYKVPEVILRIGNDRSNVEVKTSMGFDLSDLEREGVNRGSLEEVILCWSVDAYLAPRFIQNTLRIMEKYKLYENAFIKDLKKLNKAFFKKTGILPVVLNIFKPLFSDPALKKVNTYLYKNNYYSLSTAQEYNPGQRGYEQHIWQATLCDDITVFVTHPAVSLNEHNANPKRKPNYWVGMGRLPCSVQYKNINFTMFRLPLLDIAGGRKMPCFTHAYFPRNKFDSVVADGNYVFGKYRDTYIALIGQKALQFNQQADDDLIQKGRQTSWICEMGSVEDFDTFENFIKNVMSAQVSFGKGIIKYKKKGLDMLFRYKDGLYVNNKKVETEYKRLESPYGDIEKQAPAFELEYGGSGLYLDFENLIRYQY